MTKNYLDFKMGEGDKEKEWLDKEQPGNSEPFSVTNLSVYFIIMNNLALRNNFAMTKEFLIPKLNCMY